MSTEPNTPAPEVTEPETTVQTAPEVTPEPTAPVAAPEPTVAQMLGEKKVENVPIARLNKEIQRKKELENEVLRLQEQLASKPKEVRVDNLDLRSLAEEHNIDPEFLDKLAKTIKAQAESDIDEKIRPLTERDARESRDKAFAEHFAKTIEAMPEFKEVVNPSVIKQMALNPENANKTFSQLIEEAYGNTVVGKRTIETNSPRGGGKNEGLDIDRARQDTAYFKEVMANPELKRQYNEGLTNRVKL